MVCLVATGLSDLLKNLKREMGEIEGGTLAGLREVALFVENESNELAPQKDGFLIGSSFSVAAMEGKTPVARIGYTIDYATFQHEAPPGWNYTKQGSGRKFLERAVKNNIPQILNIIKRSAQVK